MKRFSLMFETMNGDRTLPEFLYHGSPRVFEEFDMNYRGRVDDGYYGPAIYFSTGIEEANDYGPNIYKVRLNGAKPFWLSSESTMGDTKQARYDLSKLPEYRELRPNTDIPEGYHVVRREPDHDGYNSIRSNVHYLVSPKPEKYDDPDSIYGEERGNPEDAIIAFNDELKYGHNSGPSTSGWTSGLLKYVGRDGFGDILMRNGYNCVATYDDGGIGEVGVFDPGIIRIVERTHQRNKYDIYESVGG